MTMPRETLSDRDLARVLDAQITAMQDVLAALESERAALAGRDGQALLEAVNRKAAALAGADTVEGRRQAMLEQLGVAPRPGRSFSADAGISQRWQQVLALTQQCRALNEANGRMIRGQRRRVDGALRILRGETAAPAEYGPAGERRANGPRRTLGTY